MHGAGVRVEGGRGEGKERGGVMEGGERCLDDLQSDLGFLQVVSLLGR